MEIRVRDDPASEDLQVAVRRLEDKIDATSRREHAAVLSISHSWIFFLKKLPITIKIRLMAVAR